MISRRTLLHRVGALAMTTRAFAAPFWQAARPEDMGFAADLGEKLEWGLKSGLLKGFHSVLVARNGKIVLERYYHGKDWAWGRPLGDVEFGPETLHDLRSVTKSVVSILYGIALDWGLVPALDAPLMAQFPEYPDLATDPQRQALKIDHVINMTLGTEWNEELPYTNPANSEIMMERAKDRFRFILDRPIIAPPGTRWNYNGGCNAIIGRLIEKGSGETLSNFARDALFSHLGIDKFEWAQGADGAYSAASGLRLTPRDLARIGLLVLGNGEIDGKRIVSSGWIEGSGQAVIPTGDGLQYSRSWFLLDTPAPAFKTPQKTMSGFGNGGQRLFLMPAAGLVCVVFGGRYDEMDSRIYPTRMWREIVLGNFEWL